jgi:hypothetical protein
MPGRNRAMTVPERSALCTPDAAPGRGRGYGRCVTWLGRAASEADPTARYAVTAEPAEAAAMPGLNRAMTVPEPVLVNYFGAFRSPLRVCLK